MKINIENRVSDFIPNVIRERLGSGVYLAGGAIRAYLSSSKIEDFDLFFKDMKSAWETKEHLLKNKFRVIFQCPNDQLTTLKKKNLKVQLITDKFFNCAADVISSFDFTICMYSTDGCYLYTTKDAMKHLRIKAIMINKITYPASSIKRFSKYQKKGFKLSEGTLKEFMNRVLHDQGDIIDFTRVYVD